MNVQDKVERGSARYIGLDLGTSCGFAVLDANGSLHDYGIWQLVKPRDDKRLRWGSLRGHLSRLVVSSREQGGSVSLAYEKVWRHVGTSAAHVYGGLEAVVEMVTLEQNIEPVALGVSQWRKLAMGDGRATKALTVAKLSTHYLRKDTMKHDCAEAIGVALACARLAGAPLALAPVATDVALK